MDSAIRSDSTDAIITLEVNGRTFTIVLVEDPREIGRDTARACELLGFQIFGLLDNVCGWTPRPRTEAEALQAEPVGPIHTAILDVLRNDVVGGPEHGAHGSYTAGTNTGLSVVCSSTT